MLRFIPGSGMAVANFRLAVDRGYTKSKKQECEAKGLATADFIKILSFGKSAENVSQFIKKGMLVAVNGKIQSGSYKSSDGTTRFTTEVAANRIEFLEWGKKAEQKSDYSFNDYSPINDDDDVPF